MLDEVNTLLHERFGITHTTLQSECRGCATDGPYCTPVHPGEERVAATVGPAGSSPGDVHARQVHEAFFGGLLYLRPWHGRSGCPSRAS